jgi:membrane-associated protein
MIIAGYGLGSLIPNLESYLHIVIVVVVALSLLPALIEWLRHR